ncbi:hypothetical protein BDZ91DRAFT_853225 [Kalaharituber pfeilii]|nr:hypothetical protein BDZ91DRAFT_853225 [Kalaharituber pfeilii]
MQKSVSQVFMPDSTGQSSSYYGPRSEALAETVNIEILKSPLFKIMVEDNEGAVYNIHKELLASLSPEFRKHTDNQMREGLHSEMLVRDVNKRTMEHFLQWAYVRDYTVKESDDLEATLQTHIELYTFGDRFNVKDLQDASFRKLESVLDEQHRCSQKSKHAICSWVGMIPEISGSIPAVVAAAKLAVETLPTSKDRLVQSLLGYLSWALPWANDLSHFAELLQQHPDIEISLMHYPPSVEEPPWAEKRITSEWERRFVCRCSRCDKVALLSRVDCHGCHVSQANAWGWFGSGTYTAKPGTACSLCGKIPDYKCSPCKDKYLSELRETDYSVTSESDESYDDALLVMNYSMATERDTDYDAELPDIDCRSVAELDDGYDSELPEIDYGTTAPENTYFDESQLEDSDSGSPETQHETSIESDDSLDESEEGSSLDESQEDSSVDESQGESSLDESSEMDTDSDDDLPSDEDSSDDSDW